MTFRLADTARNAACNAIVDLIDDGASFGVIRIYQGTQPANPQTSAAGSTLLVEIAFKDPAFGSAASGQAAMDASPAPSAVVTTGGTAQWARVLDSDKSDPNDAVFDMDVGQGSGTLSFDNTTFVASGTVTITSMTVTVPMAAL